MGNIPHIFNEDKIVFKAMDKLARKHGPVYTLWMGSDKNVIVSGVDELKVWDNSRIN